MARVRAAIANGEFAAFAEDVRRRYRDMGDIEDG
jgi:hypothetical protein